MVDRPHTVLIVDDDLAVRDALRFALRLEGFAVQIYASGADLLAQADFAGALCVVIDEKMPDMDGFALLSLLRSQAIPVPSIMITSHNTARLQVRAAAAGVDMLLEKPLLDNVLTDSIKAVRTRREHGQGGDFPGLRTCP